MLILTSPAKTLDFTSQYQSPFHTQPRFLKEAEELVSVLKKQTKHGLEEIMKVSEDIAELNRVRLQHWDAKHTQENSRPAIVAYAGDTYRYIHEYEYTEQQASYLQESLRIPSGLYGLLRPYDLIQPYRLEMNARFNVAGSSTLYSFWGDKLLDSLNKDIETFNSEYVINLTSEEYIHGIDRKKLLAPVINVVFYQQKGNQTQNIGLLSKKAWGMMIEFMVKNRVYDVAQLETFSENGYIFTAKTPDTLIFTRQLTTETQ